MMTHRHSGWLWAVVLGGAWLAVSGAAETPPDYVGLSRRVADAMLDCLQTVASPDRNAGGLRYVDGVWLGPQAANSWPAQTAAGTAAAGLWHSGLFDSSPDQKAQLLAWAIGTFDRALADHRNTDGSFGSPSSPESMFFLVELGGACLWLGDGLDAPRRAAWREALVKGIDQLVASRNLYHAETKRNWYTNGNIELDEATLLYCAFKVTSETKYQEMFERQFAFVLYPDRPRWRNFGLYYDFEPGRPDGTDGRGYLAENSSGRTGCDGEDTHFQADIATKLYLLSEDARALRLANLFLNQLLQHVDRETWIVDATVWGPHSTTFPLTTPAYALSAIQCQRPKLLAELEEQIGVTLAHYGKAAKEGWMHPGMYRGLSGELLSLLHVCQRAAAAVPAP